MSYIAKFQQNETGQRVLSMWGSNPREISELLEYLGVADKERMAPLVVKNVGGGVVQFAKKFDGTPKGTSASFATVGSAENSDDNPQADETSYETSDEKPGEKSSSR